MGEKTYVVTLKEWNAQLLVEVYSDSTFAAAGGTSDDPDVLEVV